MIELVRPLYIKQNADFSFVWKFKQAGAAVNLEGCSVKVQVRRERSLTSELLVEFNSLTDDDSCVIDEPGGTVTIQKPKAECESLSWDDPGYYDALITWSDGKTDRFARGESFCSVGVTV